MSMVAGRVPGVQHLATPPMLLMYVKSMLYCVHDGTAMSVGTALVMHLGSNPTSTEGAPEETPPVSKGEPAAGWKSGLVPSGETNNEVDIDIRLLDGMLSVGPPTLSITQPEAGSCVVPVGTPTLLIIVSPAVLPPDVK